MSFISIVVGVICVHKKHSKEAKQAIEAAGGDEQSYSRISAFTKALDPDYEAAMRESRYSVQMKKGSLAAVA